PSGRRLLFVNSEAGTTQVYTASPSGAETKQLTASPGTHAEAAWSPDGHRIAFITRVAGFGRVSLMNPDGSDQRRLSAPDASASAPAWSPDGSLIAFLARSEERRVGKECSDRWWQGLEKEKETRDKC